MTTRKRKQPEKKPPARRRQGFAMRAMAFTGRLAARHPGVFGGTAAFAVVFSFVSANALWYQPGVHPSPFLRTRIPFTQPQIAGDPALQDGDETGGIAPRKVTTFVIEREGDTPTDAPETRTASIDKTQPVDTVQTQSQPLAAPAELSDSALVTSIQTELFRQGLYEGPADGKTGPKTASAILRFEKLAGLTETGMPDSALLAALKAAPKRLAAVTPAERPYENVKATKGDIDPVAAAIRNAEVDPQFIPKTDIPASSEMVMNIQKGLSNLAYADVSIDGVAGEQTRAAIRHFEKHYRLPQTGEPNAKVLKKLKEIGAL
ncbi:peptidoglycan-binding domain-containing protein [Pararhizobium antarcticum]|uniref:Peptidoglycan-binding protein n=1 Tax=Pararhizobium antarcticum TaxID=1798805 RepID=A0A657LVK3_9HYPH|nr:peptidoglycan-binding protein [Pararhizobium antarcticum]OJF95877.1 peptidoglycan-binding protein [Pararhizobium antarcticum]OJF99319.1 peptidoglycan-binding protein [Rhizobium sp. 58]